MVIRKAKPFFVQTTRVYKYKAGTTKIATKDTLEHALPLQSTINNKFNPVGSDELLFQCIVECLGFPLTG